MSIKVDNISFSYNMGTPWEKEALQGITLDIPDKSVVGIVGEAGSGKSTLLKVIAGILKPNKGRVLIDGIENTSKKIKLGSQVGLVYQFPEQQFFLDRVYDEVAYGLKYQNMDIEQVNYRIKHALKQVGLYWEKYERARLDTLSSGEKRRVAIATILALEPKYLLLDEPTAGLDYEGRKFLNAILEDFKHVKEGAVIIVSHSLSYLISLCDVIYIVENGGIKTEIKRSSDLSSYYELLNETYQLPAYIETVLKLNEKGWNITGNITSITVAVNEILSKL